jgi:hypothetical protein
MAVGIEECFINPKEKTVSYSFSVKAATKAEAIDLANKEFDSVLNSQPVHAADMPAAREAVAAFTNLLIDDDTCDVGLSVNGSVYAVSTSSSSVNGLRQASINIQAGFNPPRK